MIPTLEQDVLQELAKLGAVDGETRMLALDRADRAETALAILANIRPLGAFRRRVAVRLAKVIAEERACGVKVRLAHQERAGLAPRR